MARPARKQRTKKNPYVENDPAVQREKFIPTTSNMVMAYNYHNENTEIDKARNWITEYLKEHWSSDHATMFGKVHNHAIPMWVCVNCHLIMMGCPITPEDHTKTDDRITLILHQVVEPAPRPSKSAPELGNPVIALVEAMLDTFYLNNYKITNQRVFDRFKEIGVKQTDARAVFDYYTGLWDELGGVLKGSDPDLKEAYSHLNKKQTKEYYQLVNSIMDDCKAYMTTQRKVTAVRKPRKVKLKSAEQLAAKVKFKAEDRELQIASISPAKIVGAQSVWLYNCKQKKLSVVVAEPNSQLSIKGTTIIGFDTAKSTTKVLRKPKEFLTASSAASKTAAPKLYDTLKTKAQSANGRLNADTIILRVT